MSIVYINGSNRPFKTPTSRGGTKEAAIVSMFLRAFGGHVSFTTTTSGPGVSGIFVERSVLPVAWSLIVIVPVFKHSIIQVNAFVSI
jgi:hypothetical protein